MKKIICSTEVYFYVCFDSVQNMAIQNIYKSDSISQKRNAFFIFHMYLNFSKQLQFRLQ